jgi:hypothetical protein
MSTEPNEMTMKFLFAFLLTTHLHAMDWNENPMGSLLVYAPLQVKQKTILDQRPQAVKESIQKTFEDDVEKNTIETPIFKQYGKEIYSFSICDPYEIFLKLEKEARSDKKMVIIDVGAGNGAWGKNMAERLSREELSWGREIEIYSLTGEKQYKLQNGIFQEEEVYRVKDFKITHFLLTGFPSEEVEMTELYKNLQGKVNLITSSWAFMHFVDPVGTLAQFVHMLRQGGYIMCDSIMPDRSIAKYGPIPFLTQWGYDFICKYQERLGFTIVLQKGQDTHIEIPYNEETSFSQTTHTREKQIAVLDTPQIEWVEKKFFDGNILAGNNITFWEELILSSTDLGKPIQKDSKNHLYHMERFQNILKYRKHSYEEIIDSLNNENDDLINILDPKEIQTALVSSVPFIVKIIEKEMFSLFYKRYARKEEINFKTIDGSKTIFNALIARNVLNWVDFLSCTRAFLLEKAEIRENLNKLKAIKEKKENAIEERTKEAKGMSKLNFGWANKIIKDCAESIDYLAGLRDDFVEL